MRPALGTRTLALAELVSSRDMPARLTFASGIKASQHASTPASRAPVNLDHFCPRLRGADQVSLLAAFGGSGLSLAKIEQRKCAQSGSSSAGLDDIGAAVTARLISLGQSSYCERRRCISESKLFESHLTFDTQRAYQGRPFICMIAIAVACIARPIPILRLDERDTNT